MTHEKTPLAVAVMAADDKRAENMMALNVNGLSSVTDTYLIMDAASERQVVAIADEIEDKMAAAGFALLRQEGRQAAQWVLLDYGDLLVHIFKRESRDFYQLEKLWSQAAEIDVSPWLAKKVAF
ncbi:ribosome silencing factor [Weissella halotolerans]|uniref:Ribosomal silencing factor RsfS n=1 Tax=Weissella halotolerans DSM 20190 TaxID=1123500 RepID=A0A0R2G2Q5_9LACO|nr:ribosome silencing factor [Weissella halotolerans]KRN32533.1 Iojap family protein [Weissella halotolerans DSM 20190]